MKFNTRNPLDRFLPGSSASFLLGVVMSVSVYTIIENFGIQDSATPLYFLDQVGKEMPEQAQKLVKLGYPDCISIEEKNGVLYIRDRNNSIFSLRKILDKSGKIYAWVLVDDTMVDIWAFSDNTIQSTFFFPRKY